MSKTIIVVSHFGLGGRESLETAVNFEFYSIFSKFVIFFGEGTNDTPPLLRPWDGCLSLAKSNVDEILHLWSNQLRYMVGTIW